MSGPYQILTSIYKSGVQGDLLHIYLHVRMMPIRDEWALACIIDHYYLDECIFNIRSYKRSRSLSLLAHLSRRLIGELIVYPWSGVRRPSVDAVRSQCSNIFFSQTAWPIKAKFYVEPPWVGGTKFCLRHLGHMTKMAATPIYGKNPLKIFSRTGRRISTKLGM